MMKRKLFQILLITFCTIFLAGSCNSSDNGSKQETIQKHKMDTISEDLDTETFKLQYSESKEAILIDVRTPQEVSEGYIKGAKNIDFYSDEFMNKINGLDKTKPVYLYCRSGGRSGKAKTMLKDAGFTEVYNLLGGFNGWKEAGNDILIPPN